MPGKWHDWLEGMDSPSIDASTPTSSAAGWQQKASWSVSPA